MAIEFTKEVSDLSDSEVEAERIEILNAPQYKESGRYHFEGPKYQERMQKIYSRKFPEPPSRSAELPEMRSTYDAIVKSGIQSPEEAEKIGEEGRQKILDEEADREATRVEVQLKMELGDQFEPTVNTGKFVLDKVFKPEDKEKILNLYGSDPDFIKWIGQAGKFFDTDDFWKGQAAKYVRKEND